MKPKEIKELIKKNYSQPPERRRPIFIWGTFGVGKSSLVREVCEELGIELIDLRLTLLEPMDLRGMPVIEDKNGEKTVVWARPVFLPKEGRGILFIDECNVAAPAMQAVSYQLILDHRVGEHVVGKDWYIIGAGNEETDGALVYRMPTPLRNRFIHVKFEVNAEQWIEWALTHGIHEWVIGFISFRPDMLCPPYDPAVDPRSTPRPRTWHFVSDMLKAGVSDQESIAGCVGEGAAADFIDYVKYHLKLPSVDAILKGELEKLPEYSKEEIAGIQHALIASVCSKITGLKNKREAVNNALKFFMDNFQAEFVILSLKRLSVVYANIPECPVYPEFHRRYKEVIL
jgi:hypothetical protein